MPPTSVPKRFLAAMTSVVLAAVFTPLAIGSVLSSAAADTTPPAPAALPATVSADALPTVQINGVAWAQLVVGNTVYVAGSFTSARPSGSPVGTNETPRSNLLAYDLTSGQLNTAWAPLPLNGDALTLAASADGKTIYVGGTFNKVGTDFTNSFQWRSRMAAFDATTGALVKSFAPAFGTTVRSVAVVGNTVYAGGDFNAVNGTARAKLAAVDATNGSTLPWAPQANAPVLALLPMMKQNEIVVGGRFNQINGATAQGSGAVDATTGSSLAWDAQNTAYSYGTGAGITSLSTDGTSVFATSYSYYDGTSDLENTFAADPAGGRLLWLNPCLGDTYSSFVQNGAVYIASHTHDCSAMGGFPDAAPRPYQWASAMTTAGSGKTNNANAYGWAGGTPGTNLLYWAPTFTPGSYTGQGQSAWSVAGNSQYVVYGGEFGTVNGVSQQGLTRFTLRSSAPNKQGPLGGSDLTPSATSTYPGQVRVAWRSAWDRDDATLTYQLLRGTGATPTVVATTTASSAWWNRPPLALTDPSPGSGTQTYRVRVTDPSGNTVTSAASTVAVTTAAPSAYVQAVKADGAVDYWRLGDKSGVVGVDSIGQSDLTVHPSETRSATGALPDGDTAMTFTGTTQIPNDNRFGPSYIAVVPAATTNTLDGPQTYTTEAWINTTTTSGGKIIGFGDSNRDASSSYDRQVYMTNDGRLVAGVYNGAINTAASTKSYNDGQWHHVVSTLGASGLSLYVDGVKVAANGAATQAQPFNGYWRIGGDNLNAWPDQPTSSGFAGTIDDVAVYPAPLTGTQVRAHYAASGRTAVVPPKPADAAGAAVYDSAPDAYWRLQETTGTSLADSGPDGSAPGVVNGTPTLGAPGVPGITGSTGISFDGTAGSGLASSERIPAPTTYSEELWFKTTSTRGGKLIGFGDAQSGYSGSNDRSVIMKRDGTIFFGTWTGSENRATSTKAYNDGAWHHVIAAQGASGMALYVDGALAASNPQTQAQSYTGYWRVGGDSGWDNTDNGYIDGTVDDVAVYGRALTASDAAAHFRAGGGNLAPTAVFTPAVTGLSVSVDASASTDADGSIASYGWTFGDGGTGTGATAQHAYAKPGTYTVGLTTTDDKGATATSQQQVTVRDTTAVPADTYGKAVYAAGPDAYYRLDDAAGATTATDSSGLGNTGAIHGGVRTGAPGVSSAVGAGTGATLDGQVGTTIVDPQRLDGPTTYSLEMWFSTTSTRGGKLIGFGDGDGTGYSGNYDRHVIMNTDGTLHFGVWTGQENRVDTSTAYNDGKWHHLVATQGPAGMVMYVDGQSVGTNGQTQAQGYSGYWRVGGDSSWGPTQNGFVNGSVDEVAIYSKVLNASTVADHFAKGAPAPVNQAPTAAFTAAATGLSAAFDASASKDADGTVASYAWDFGDGTKGTGVTATHAYAAAGTYTATLVVTDDKGATGTNTQQVTTTAPVNTPPTAAFTSTISDLTAAFDASGSKDADGTVASYAWDFGDGTKGTGVSPRHTYTTAGARTVTLTVTDDKGATSQVSHDITVTAPTPVNQAPTASFTSATTNLVAAFDASASADSDGTVASYAWDFGDGSTGTGVKASHAYAAAGTYKVMLTVTDNQGAKSSLTSDVTVTAAAPANKAPTAAFTSASTGLAAAFDGSASSDPDGSVASYSWDFGDQTTGTGAKPSHTYAAAGTYQVTLTVTDNQGATGTKTSSLVVTTAGQPTATVLASDAFGRTTSGGWGTADTGGTWSTAGAASSYSVSSGAGQIVLGAPSTVYAATLKSVSAANVDVTAGVSFDRAVTGGAAYASFQARQSTSGDYRLKTKVAANGAVTLALVKVVNGTETSLRSATLSGVTLAPGQTLRVRFSVTGTGTSTLSAKAWLGGTAEPQPWGVTATDTTATLQGAGAVGVVGYALSTTAGATPVTLSVTGYAVKPATA